MDTTAKTIACMAVAASLSLGVGAGAAAIAGDAASAPGEQSFATHRGKGIVEKVDAAARRMTIKHGPVPSAGWSAGTTTFEVGERVSFDGIRSGNEVDFEFVPADGRYRITTLSKSTAADGRADARLPRSGLTVRGFPSSS
ncbi:MAG: copper-binding protein [Rhodospirillaceae bacterium]